MRSHGRKQEPLKKASVILSTPEHSRWAEIEQGHLPGHRHEAGTATSYLEMSPRLTWGWPSAEGGLGPLLRTKPLILFVLHLYK